jgi:hypothetical protein
MALGLQGGYTPRDVSWGRLLVAVLLAVSLASGTAPGPGRAPAAQAGPLRQVVAGQVTAFIPRDWDVRPLAPHGAPGRDSLPRSGTLPLSILPLHRN